MTAEELLKDTAKISVRSSAPSLAELPPGRLLAVKDGSTLRLYFNFNGTLGYVEFQEA